MSPVPPALKAMLVCDLFIRDESTRRASLIGIVEQIQAPLFPATLQTLFVYATITDGEGDYRIRLDDRNSVGELTFNLGGLVIERPGRYDLAFFANDRLVGTKSLPMIQSVGGDV